MLEVKPNKTYNNDNNYDLELLSCVFCLLMNVLAPKREDQSISIGFTINPFMREDGCDEMRDPPLPPLAHHASQKLEWRSLAYYNCASCNRVGADYIINKKPREQKTLPTPICSSCYYRMLNSRLDKNIEEERRN